MRLAPRHRETPRIAASDDLLARLPVAVSLIRAADGIIVFVNAAWEELFGYPAGEAVGRHVSLILAPLSHAPQELAAERARALSHDGRWRGRVECVRKDGSRVWTASHLSGAEHPREGAVWVSVQADIGDRQAELQEARDTSGRWFTAFEDAPVGLAIVAPDLRMTDANARLCALTGHTREELTGMSLSSLLHPGDVGANAALGARLRRGELPRYALDARVVRRDGDVVPVVLSVSLARGAGGEVLHELAAVAER